MSLASKSGWRPFAVIVVVASMIRGGALYLTSDGLSADPDAYRRIASCLCLHGTFGLEIIDPITGKSDSVPTAFRPPLYPWLISWMCDESGHIANVRVAIFQWLLGIATVAGTFSVARKLLGRDSLSSGVAAALLVAIDPLLIQSASQVMTETVATAIVVMTLWCWVMLAEMLDRSEPPALAEGIALGPRRAPPAHEGNEWPIPRVVGWAAAAGCCFAIAYLCRPTFVLWPVFVSGVLVLRSIIFRERKSAVVAACVTVVMVASMAAWTIRNERIYGKAIWATTHGGYTLLLGNNPSFYDYIRKDDCFTQAWDANFFIQRWDARFTADPREASFWKFDISPAISIAPSPPMGEVADDSLAYQTAMMTIQGDPWTFVRASLWRLMRLHSPNPLQTGSISSLLIAGVTGFYVASGVLVLLGFASLGTDALRIKWIAGFALWVAIASVHTFYWTDMRMRTPLVPFLAILAAAGAMALLKWWTGRAGKSRLSDRQS